jgi:hypothetical protein
MFDDLPARETSAITALDVSDLLRAIDAAARHTSDLPEADIASAAWVRIATLVEALTLVVPALPDRPTGNLAADMRQGSEPVVRLREQVAIARDLLQAAERRAAAATHRGLPGYFAATTDLIVLLDRSGSKTDLQRARRRHLAWEYAHGRNPESEQWSIEDLAKRTGLLRSTAAKLVEEGRRVWQASGVVLPR